MFSLCAIHTLVTVRYVKKEVLFMMFLVELTHRCTCGWDHIVNKEEQCILRSQVNSLSDEEVKLSNWKKKNYIKLNNSKYHCRLLLTCWDMYLYLASKLWIENTIYVSYWRRDCLLTWLTKPRKGLPSCRAKAVTSFHFSQLFRAPTVSLVSSRLLDMWIQYFD